MEELKKELKEEIKRINWKITCCKIEITIDLNVLNFEPPYAPDQNEKKWYLEHIKRNNAEIKIYKKIRKILYKELKNA